MLTVDVVYLMMLFISLSLMMSQLLVAKKQAIHIVFAIFCGSISMVALQHLTQQSLGIYAYLIGIGTCATCNGFWLVSRALFRDKNPIAMRHVLLAALVAVLVIMGQGMNMANAISPQYLGDSSSIRLSLNEVVGMLSSVVLALTFWEACRGFTQQSRTQKLQRLVFIYAFVSGVFLCMIIAEVFIPKANFSDIFPYFVAFSATQMLIATQIIILWQRKEALKLAANTESEEALEYVSLDYQVDECLVAKIRHLLIEEKLFLQPSLKMIDIAKNLQVPEYKVSKAVRHSFKASNFNQFVNRLRIEHAKSLLEQESSKGWSVLVIGLESGFASIGPFNRAFKHEFNCTPSEYRRAFFKLRIYTH